VTMRTQKSETPMVVHFIVAPYYLAFTSPSNNPPRRE
jgi:hypothetical protein